MPSITDKVRRVMVHPGEILREDFMEPLGLSSNKLAAELKVPSNRISELVAGRRSMTADTALRLARYFGTTPDLWMNLQQNHDLTKAQAESGPRIEAEVQPRAEAA